MQNTTSIADYKIKWIAPDDLTPYDRNARTHSNAQVKQIAASIRQFGFTNPVLVSDDGGIIAGHGRVEAAKLLSMTEVPTICLAHLSETERRAYILADNKLAERAGWDDELLALELRDLSDLAFDLDLTGFELAEVDMLISSLDAPIPAGAADALPEQREVIRRTQRGDLWALGPHRLACGDARQPSDLKRLCGGHIMDLIFTDPPYNVPINGHVLGKGQHRHQEFAFASGEMTQPEFTAFLRDTLGLAAQSCKDGAIAFVCMDWRHMGELIEAGTAVFSELKNLCVWNKTNAGMGSFYRSKHELVFVYKIGRAPHTNAFKLGETGRYRTNVWDYAGANTVGHDRDEALAMHPTVKPVELVADAILDCTRRGERVLDPFAGSGTTLIAAERTGRIAHILEYDPHYCDVILARFEALTGKSAERLYTVEAAE